MSIYVNRDIGAQLVVKEALNPEVVTAGASPDGVERDGTAIDRNALGSLFESCKVAITGYYAGLGTTDSITIASNLQDSSASSAGWADLSGTTGVSYTLAAVGTTVATGNGAATYDVDLSGAKRWIRLQETVTLSATATDTVDVGGVIVFGGSAVKPAA